MSHTDYGDTPAVFQPKPDQPPPLTTVGVVGWLRANLAPDWINFGLTLIGLVAIYFIATSILNWAVLDAHFIGDNRQACKPNVQTVFDKVKSTAILPDGSAIDEEATGPLVVVLVGVTPNVRW